ncbi:MAG: pirin family protein [Candidatus Hodarchaeales archaeon]|jgi:redox-sensitive bicupin YhaK (pirin superfamily)
MNNFRTIDRIQPSFPTMDGAGVKLKRVFSHQETKLLDPFLLLDAFGSDNPADYIAGFPEHPHRGIETVTYMLEGLIKHKDSIGNSGILGSGDIQWMTAGGGIVHEEMPQLSDGTLAGFQLWVNLPRSSKMIDPRYQDISASQVPEIELDRGIKVRVLAGKFNETEGPVKDIIAEPHYLDVEIPPGITFTHTVEDGHTVFAYIFEGKGNFSPNSDKYLEEDNLVVYNRKGDTIQVTTKDDYGVRFLLISGKPINEPIAWGGPIVMNTQEELRVAFEEYRNGTFLKKNNLL